jgi:hypothetical protein
MHFSRPLALDGNDWPASRSGRLIPVGVMRKVVIPAGNRASAHTEVVSEILSASERKVRRWILHLGLVTRRLWHWPALARTVIKVRRGCALWYRQSDWILRLTVSPSVATVLSYHPIVNGFTT